MNTLKSVSSFFCTLLLVTLGTLASFAVNATQRGPKMLAQAGPLQSEAQVIVKFKISSSALSSLSNGTTPGPQSAQLMSARLGLSLSNGHAMGPRLQVLKGSGVSSAELARQLSAQSDVEYAVPDSHVRALSVSVNDPLYLNASASQTPFAGQWYLQTPSSDVAGAINMLPAWAVTTGKSSIVVADLDSGIRFDHPDLSTKLLAGYDFVTDPLVANDGDGRDPDASDPGDWITASESASGFFAGCAVENSSWHGTMTAGLIGAATNNGIGMASVGHDVTVLPLRVIGKCGGAGSDVIDAMRWAAGLAVSGVPTNPNPAQVINMSIGSFGSCDAAFQDAVNDVVAANVVVVAAAGNEGLAAGEPANCNGAIAVSGVQHTGTKVFYSSLGAAITIAAPSGDCPNGASTCLYPILTSANSGITTPMAGAPGATYTSGGADASLGTSFAAPLVSGTVALMLSANPALTPAQVAVALQSTARVFPTTGAAPGTPVCTAPSNVPQWTECYCTTSTCGAGLLDAGAAVASVSTTPVAPIANINVATTAAVVGTPVTLDGSSSTASGKATISGYSWSIAAGSASITSSSTASSVTILPTAAGNVTVALTVTDNSGQTDVTSVTLTVTAAPTVGSTPTTPATPASGPPATASSSSGGGAMNGWMLIGIVLCVGLVGWASRPKSSGA